MKADIFVNFYGIESNMMESLDANYYYAGDNVRDPYGTNKVYNSGDIVKMIYDIEEYSSYE
jgi:hypothetical protein